MKNITKRTAVVETANSKKQRLSLDENSNIHKNIFESEIVFNEVINKSAFNQFNCMKEDKENQQNYQTEVSKKKKPKF